MTMIEKNLMCDQSICYDIISLEYVSILCGTCCVDCELVFGAFHDDVYVQRSHTLHFIAYIKNPLIVRLSENRVKAN